ncbi:hypothetical protein E2C01_093040 [Portunus trituberculatus]|uniref:Uncharacterized protein n=1 Tax=Portunus trituberculatus TaxID=210409 RepID=A0A5B7JTH0_PORTR|nr:hypothetical protein [Portunus trituberculatus]
MAHHATPALLTTTQHKAELYCTSDHITDSNTPQRITPQRDVTQSHASPHDSHRTPCSTTHHTYHQLRQVHHSHYSKARLHYITQHTARQYNLNTHHHTPPPRRRRPRRHRRRHSHN